MTNVLVVEDDQSIAELVCDVLEEARYTLAVARDGVAALQRLQQQRPDLMLLDLRMPRMGGAALLHACGQDPRLQDLRVVLLSAASDVGPVAAQAQVLLHKPFDIAELLESVQSALRARVCVDAPR